MLESFTLPTTHPIRITGTLPPWLVSYCYITGMRFRTATTVQKYRTFAYSFLFFSALLFDVSPELNENDPSMFTLKIGPTRYKSPFEVDGTEDDPCYASQFERDQKTVDLENLYKEYKSCKVRICIRIGSHGTKSNICSRIKYLSFYWVRQLDTYKQNRPYSSPRHAAYRTTNETYRSIESSLTLG